MKRRDLIAGAAGTLLGSTYATRVSAMDDVAAVTQAIKNVYAVFYQQRDEAEYRRLLTDDYQLLEHGELLDIEGDI
jgi:hypothetical protein